MMLHAPLYLYVPQQSEVKFIILYNSKKKKSSKYKNPYVEVEFEAPVVGLWSPAKTGYAPFMCIEPWYGRCDDSNFVGDYNQKPYINHLVKGEVFSAQYTMRFM